MFYTSNSIAKCLPLFKGAAAIALCLSASTTFASPLGNITIATNIDLTSLDSSQNVTGWHRWVYRNLYDPLLTLGRDGNIKPSLAESWERIDDTTYRFHLRKDVKFHNGEPLTAEAVQLWVESAKQTGSQARGSLALIKKARVVDEHTVDLITDGPVAYFINTIPDRISALPPKYYAEVGGQKFANNPIGTGPYRFESWRRGDRIVLTANENWWGGKPKADKVTFWVVPDASARAAAVLNGEAELGVAIAPLEASRFKASTAARIEPSPTGSRPIWGGLMYNRPIFADKRVREAVNLAVNRQAIVDRLLRGYGKTMGQLCATSMECFDPDIKAVPYDAERARQLIAEAGAKGKSIVLQAPQGPVPLVQELTQVISANLRAVGLNVTVQIDEAAQFSKKLYDFKSNNKDVGDIFIYSYQGGSGSETTIRALTATDGIWNWSHYNSPVVDELWKRASATFDATARQTDMRKLSGQVRKDYGWLFLYEPITIWAVSNKIDWKARNDEQIIVQEMELKDK